MSHTTTKPQAQIFYHDIGDYLTRDEKLAKITGFKSLAGITAANGWQPITPDAHHDWVGQRDDRFAEFLSLGDKKDKNSLLIFENYSKGLMTGRDAWNVQYSAFNLNHNIQKMILFYQTEVDRFLTLPKEKVESLKVEDFVTSDSTKLNWNRSLLQDFQKGLKHSFNPNSITNYLYRPFSKAWCYFDKPFIEMRYQTHKLFPTANSKNMTIVVTGLGTQKDFSVLATNVMPDVQVLSNCQCFALNLHEYVPESSNQQQAFDDQKSNPAIGEYTLRDGISDAGLQHFKDAYASDAAAQSISKEDLFYYIYGLLHSPDYKTRYADNLSKELPRIPAVKKFTDFQAFSAAGRALADLHVNYETVTPYPVSFAGGAIEMAAFTDADYRVVQMKFGKGTGKSGDERHDKTRVIYNSKITMEGIPLEAYEYVVNGKPALEWVMERQAVTTHKDSGIVNDANLWATETMGDAAYPLKLFQRVVTVGLETVRIVKSLPRLEV